MQEPEQFYSAIDTLDSDLRRRKASGASNMELTGALDDAAVRLLPDAPADMHFWLQDEFQRLRTQLRLSAA